MNAGVFITFEGGEGSGKSTQIKLLRQRLEAENYAVIQTREPGGTDEAEKIRNLMVQRDGGNWSAREECLLLYAARSGHVERVIKPALAKGTIVLCDRFSDSTMAYQGYGHGLDLTFIKDLDALVLGGFKPDLTFILDIDPEMGLARTEMRLAKAKNHESTEDRFERLDFTFHKKLRQGYTEIAQHNPERCVVMNGALSLNELKDLIAKRTLKTLKRA